MIHLQKCDRCRSEVSTTTMSMLNTDTICLQCKDTERRREDYDAAVAKDLRQYADRLRGLGMDKQADTIDERASVLDPLNKLANPN